MESTCWRTAERLRFLPPRIPHAVAVMVVVPAFHTEDPDRVGDTLNISLFPDFSPSAGSEASLITQQWGAMGETYYFPISRLMSAKEVKVLPPNIAPHC